MGNQQWDGTQIAVLDACVACAEEKGFASVTTRRVAELAGVNEVTIFRRFGSKSGLINAVFEREAAAMSDAVGHYSGNLQDDLRRMVMAVWDATGRRQAVIPAILSELATNAELRSAASHSVREMARVTDIIAKYQERGLLIDEPPLHAYAALVGPLVYLGIVSRLLPDQPELDVDAHVEKYLKGHVSKGES